MTVPTVKSSLLARVCAVVCAAAGIAGPGIGAASAGDGSWMYRRSYFSHALPPYVQARYPQPVSRSAYRIPYAYEAPGMGIRGVYRYNPIMLYDGRSTDVTIYRQNWFQLQP